MMEAQKEVADWINALPERPTISMSDMGRIPYYADWAHYYSEVSIKYYEVDKRFLSNVFGTFMALFTLESIFFNEFVLFYAFFMAFIFCNIIIWEYYSMKKYDKSVRNFWKCIHAVLCASISLLVAYRYISKF